MDSTIPAMPDDLERIIDRCTERGVAVQVVVHVHVVKDKRPPANDDLLTKAAKRAGFTKHGFFAAAAIARGELDASQMSIRKVQDELGIPHPTLYKDKVFRSYFTEYQATGRTSLPKGSLDVRSGNIEAVDDRDDD